VHFMGSSVNVRYFFWGGGGGGGVKCHLLNIGVKSVNGWVDSSGGGGVKCIFPIIVQKIRERSGKVYLSIMH
jgi:hypothetical protein